ncbi:hypothetical protein [Schaalia georgiae]|uniref:hypothetical protein n=1 Tax=Schaalia georgiae TaxID=52768 RepID=UPI00047C7F22|nr:hypothetical protein [Schaalia georgiae]
MRLFRYASYFPDLPGHTSTINHFASELREWHTKALSIYEDLGYALHGYTEWQGKAQEEFVSTVVAERGQMDALCEGLSRAYQAVEAFAGVCYNQYWEVADIRYRAEQLDAYYDGLSWSEAWEQSSAIDAQFALLQALYGDVKARRAEAEADCAAVLREALHVEPVDIRKPDDADQSPFNASELRAMSQGTLDSLAEEIEHGSHPPFAIAQGSIGDCYFLASVGAFAQTQRGRDYLYSLVRVHRDAEGAVDGFLVTMPGTPHDPNPSGEDTVFVSDTYVRGANGAQPNIASIFESALAQTCPAGTQSLYSLGAGSGFSAVGMHVLSGHKGGIAIITNDPVKAERIPQHIEFALDQGHPVTTETSPVSHTAEVEVDGTRKTITIEAAHAYTVIAADDGGITISNPWGHNNEAGGSGSPANNKPQVGGTFRMSWDDYRRCFMSYTYGRIP